MIHLSGNEYKVVGKKSFLFEACDHITRFEAHVWNEWDVCLWARDGSNNMYLFAPYYVMIPGDSDFARCVLTTERSPPQVKACGWSNQAFEKINILPLN